MKLALVLGVCWLALACDPARQIGIAVEPRPVMLTDSVRQAAYAVAGRVSAQHGLAPFDSKETYWHQCFLNGNLRICGKPSERGVEFYLFEGLAPRWSPRADSVRRELLASLRAQFGDRWVRECAWVQPRDPRQAACTPATQRDSS